MFRSCSTPRRGSFKNDLGGIIARNRRSQVVVLADIDQLQRIIFVIPHEAQLDIERPAGHCDLLRVKADRRRIAHHQLILREQKRSQLSPVLFVDEPKVARGKIDRAAAGPRGPPPWDRLKTKAVTRSGRVLLRIPQHFDPRIAQELDHLNVKRQSIVHDGFWIAETRRLTVPCQGNHNHIILAGELRTLTVNHRQLDASDVLAEVDRLPLLHRHLFFDVVAADKPLAKHQQADTCVQHDDPGSATKQRNTPQQQHHSGHQTQDQLPQHTHPGIAQVAGLPRGPQPGRQQGQTDPQSAADPPHVALAVLLCRREEGVHQ